MLYIKIPSFSIREVKYTLKVVFGDFLGIKYIVQEHSEDCIEISGYNNKKLVLDISFFKIAAKNWLLTESMPKTPLDFYKIEDKINLCSNEVPVLYGKSIIKQRQDKIYIGIDILGSIFFMLSRYEEAICKEKDEHNRFDVNFSIAYKEGFLKRSIVNEYLEIIYFYIKLLFPNIERKKRDYKLIITSDIDNPIDIRAKSFKRTLLSFGKATIVYKNVPLATNLILNYIGRILGTYKFDTYLIIFIK